MSSSSGYLDDDLTRSSPVGASSSGSGSSGGGGRSSSHLTSTSLFATLAQRQMDQQHRQPPMSQSAYDDESAWTTRSHRPAHRTHHDPDSSRPRNSHRRRQRSITMDSDSTGSYASDSDDYASSTTSSHDRALQQEWQDQLEQLKLMFQIIIFPFAGKFFGRKFGYFLFNRYRLFGSPFGARFWTGAAAAMTK